MLNHVELPGVTLHQYGPGIQSDTFLLLWWSELVRTGEIDQTFGAPGRCLTEFCRILRASRVWYTVDDEGAWNRVAWSAPVLGGADFGCWLREDQRQSKDSLAFVVAALREVFAVVPVCIALTTQRRVVRDLMTLGFVALDGQIPDLFDEQPVTLLHLTRARFQGRW